MRTDLLFGTKFITDKYYVDAVLDHYSAWRQQKLETSHQLATKATIEFAKLIGLDAEEAEQELTRLTSELNRLPDFKEVQQFLQNHDCKHYYITPPVLAMCQKIKVNEPFDLEWLQAMPDGKRQLNFGNRFFRYEKTGVDIVAMDGQDIQKGIGMEYNFFYFNLAAKKAGNDDIIDDYADNRRNVTFNDGIDEAARKLFFQLVTFMELADIQEVLVPAGRKHGTRNLTTIYSTRRNFR